MGKILVIDDMQFWRDIAADVLREKGHTVFTAADGVDGLSSLRANGADLIVLDVEMPRLAGFSFLDQLRQDDQWKNLPVIMLTGDTQKEDVLRAKKLGAVDYMIKSRFDIPSLLDRVQKRLAGLGKLETTTAHSIPPSSVAVDSRTNAPPQSTSKLAAAVLDIGPLLTRDSSIERLEHALEGRTLSGVVAKVIAYAGAERMDISDLADLIGRDPILTARVLQTANSAAFISNRAAILTLSDAVRVIGSTAVRDIAASVGVFEAMPAPEADGFNPIHCWQHSLAVAMLCNHVASNEQRGLAYLVGLCHNLGEILFRTHFGAEYRAVLEAEKISGKPRRDLERLMLGITRGELVEKILERLDLPPAICRPIIAYHHSSRPGADKEPLARVLKVADVYATAMMLVSSDESVLQPLTRAECRAATGREDALAPNGNQFRSAISAMTAMYVHLSAAEQAELTKNLKKRRPVRVWLARDSAFSPFDPIAAALGALSDVEISNSLPTPAELAAHKALIVLARNSSVPGLTASNIAAAATRPDGAKLPILWLTGRKNDSTSLNPSDSAATCWPVSLNFLADFIQEL